MMKKTIVWVFALLFVLAATVGCAEQTVSFFAQFEGMEWSFSSGAGGWSTDLRILPDGSFSGEFHDSEMGESADAYPGGTVYYCSFTGSMSLSGQADENPCTIRIDSLIESPGQEETIDDGIRFVPSRPYGLSEGDEMQLYRPGTPTDGFTDEMKMWAHLFDEAESEPATLENWFLYSAGNDSGFVGIAYDTGMNLANPWQDLSAEQIHELTDIPFSAPEGAENVIYRWLGSESLAEMQFTIYQDDFCFRAQPAALEKGELQDISGMYFAWENEEDITVDGFSGTIGQAQTGSEDWVERCLWFDDAAGIMCSLSVATTELDGLDLTAVAEQIYHPSLQ